MLAYLAFIVLTLRHVKTIRNGLDRFAEKNAAQGHAGGEGSVSRRDWRDAMNDRCWHLGTLAGLLEVCGQPLEPEVLEGIGHVIEQDVEAMKALLNELEAGR